MTMPELALRWILEHPAVSTTIPGMRKTHHAAANLSASDGKRLDPEAGAAAQGPPLGSKADEVVAITARMHTKSELPSNRLQLVKVHHFLN